MTSAKGLTLIELLAALALLGVVSALILGVLVSGINSYKSVNKQISLQDEANAIMTRFSNEIFVAVKVEALENQPVKSIDISKYGGEKVTLEFANGKAMVIKEEKGVIKNNVINSSMVKVTNDSKFIVNKVKGIVQIQLTVEDDNGRELNLTEEVTYVPVE